jgi:hypothetical protein
MKTTALILMLAAFTITYQRFLHHAIIGVCITFGVSPLITFGVSPLITFGVSPLITFGVSPLITFGVSPLITSQSVCFIF